MSRAGDFDKVVRSAIEQGFKHERTSGGHHQFLSPDGVSIVHTSGTTANHREWQKMMGELKRAGFSESFEPPPSPNGQGKLSVSQYIIDLLARHPEGLPVSDINAYLLSVRPQLSRNAAYSVLNDLLGKNKLKRSAAGTYALADVIIGSVFPSARHMAIPFPYQEPSSAPVGQLATTAPKPASGEATEDSDLATLDEVLDALVKLQAIVIKHREIALQRARLKELL